MIAIILKVKDISWDIDARTMNGWEHMDEFTLYYMVLSFEASEVKWPNDVELKDWNCSIKFFIAKQFKWWLEV